MVLYRTIGLFGANGWAQAWRWVDVRDGNCGQEGGLGKTPRRVCGYGYMGLMPRFQAALSVQRRRRGDSALSYRGKR